MIGPSSGVLRVLSSWTCDHHGYLPRFAVITGGKIHEFEVAPKLRLEPRNACGFDRGHIDYQCFVELIRLGVYWVM